LPEGHPGQEFPKPLYPVTFLRIDIDKDEGNQKIDARIDSMFQKGIVKEVEGLVSQYPKTCRSFLAIGYKEIIQGLKKRRPRQAWRTSSRSIPTSMPRNSGPSCGISSRKPSEVRQHGLRL
jgi:tRNA A37 N6-isopentenylltransferase MiaA